MNLLSDPMLQTAAPEEETHVLSEQDAISNIPAFLNTLEG